MEAESEIQVEQAGKRPLAEEQVRKQLEKTGETPFVFETLDIGMDPNAFLPMQQLNEMRRRALMELEKQICRQYHRELRENPENRENRAVFCDREEIVYKNTNERSAENRPELTILTETIEQLRTVEAFVEEYGGIHRVYVDSACLLYTSRCV